MSLIPAEVDGHIGTITLTATAGSRPVPGTGHP
jgi:hypothetical protein